MSTLIPTIKWSQNDEYVIINLEINQVKNDVYEINNNNIVFTGVSNTDLNYSINLELLNTVNKDESKYIVEERVIRFVLKKTEYEKWIRLTKDKNQYKSKNYVAFGLNAGFDLDDNFSIFAEGRNLFNKNYSGAVDVLSQATSNNVAVYYPASLRAFYFGLKYKL